MNAEPPNPGQRTSNQPGEASQGLAALARVDFDGLDTAGILDAASAAVATMSPCRVEASYRRVGSHMVRHPPSQPERPDIDKLLLESGFDGSVTMPDKRWGWAFGLRTEGTVNGWLIVSAVHQPMPNDILLLTILAQQAGAALGFAPLHSRDAHRANQLAAAFARLQSRTRAHEVIGAALATDSGEQGIADALHELTARAVSVEDRFGNLRSWAGPGRPDIYPKPDPDRRALLLHELAARPGAMRVNHRMVILVKPHAEVLAVLALIDPGKRVTDDEVFALEFASTALGLELSYQRNLAEMELNLRRELVDDLVAGTDDGSAYARAAAIGHDFHRPHYVAAVHCAGGADSVVAAAAGRAATALQLEYLLGRHAGLVVLITAGFPEPGALYREISRHLGRASCVIGIGSRCERPRDCPESFAKARRTLNIRLHSATPDGASAYDQLGFYHLVDAAHSAGVLNDFVREWLGVLIDYDNSKTSELVPTLSGYLESGGSYDDAAAALHIHRSTLRYRLSRIGQLTGYDLRNVDTRFNLHAATRAWRFLNGGS
ncbi:MAG: hypothetical protein JWR32_1140 [Mycobacterium sp.]|jgi:hypothetical protein|nr:hypothetical protein [Mycobacterium sp.]